MGPQPRDRGPGPIGHLCLPKIPIWTPSARGFASWKRTMVRSDCSRISGLCVEPRGLRGMMEHARGVPIDRAATEEARL